MGSLRKPSFFHHHLSPVRSVAWHPTNRYLFCSGGADGKVNLYSAKDHDVIHSYTITLSTVAASRSITAVRFSTDGRKILVTTSAKRLIVLNLEQGCPELTYEGVAHNARDSRVPLAVDAASINLFTCANGDGLGINLFDSRIAQPIKKFAFLHSSIIRDITFLDPSWPWCNSQQGIVTVSLDQAARVFTLEGRLVNHIDVQFPLHCVSVSPEKFHPLGTDGFNSQFIFGGSSGVSVYRQRLGIQEQLECSKDTAVLTTKYNAHGSVLYTGSDDGLIRRYRRHPEHHTYLDDVCKHGNGIQDMDISPNDEFIVTASADPEPSVGLVHLEAGPNHGATEYREFT